MAARGQQLDSARLREAVAASISLAETLRRLGLPDTGAKRVLLRRRIAEEGISLAHFLGQAHQRGKPSPTPRKEAGEILVKHDRARRTKTTQLRRALKEIGVPERCAECGTGPVWQDRPLTLEVDHVNGDWQDDRPGNLRLLCPNCHATTDTWCGANRRRWVAGGG
ncbi:HNH endonuclease signature motif containing protein [Streptomyces sp. CBMA29]|uniref:HNH endonuclease signature motif containing protein n=1 Tax=Streptomyces sp. CBMA29 TaxID=1896314 RepID=UPI001661A8FF|nr:HNH endonuclease signature motif containing protein [Streptomyces sp. CBMA29]